MQCLTAGLIEVIFKKVKKNISDNIILKTGRIAVDTEPFLTEQFRVQFNVQSAEPVFLIFLWHAWTLTPGARLNIHLSMQK